VKPTCAAPISARHSVRHRYSPDYADALARLRSGSFNRSSNAFARSRSSRALALLALWLLQSCNLEPLAAKHVNRSHDSSISGVRAFERILFAGGSLTGCQPMLLQVSLLQLGPGLAKFVPCPFQ
jgi:hypothetical protein